MNGKHSLSRHTIWLASFVHVSAVIKSRECHIAQEMDSIAGWQALAAQVMQEVSADDGDASSAALVATAEPGARGSSAASLRSIAARPGCAHRPALMVELRAALVHSAGGASEPEDASSSASMALNSPVPEQNFAQTRNTLTVTLLTST